MPRKKATKAVETVIEAAKDAASDNKKRKLKFSKDVRAMFAPMSAGSRSEVVSVIPTQNTVLDHYVLGCGGWPCRRIVELYSEPGGGKTSLVLAAIASTQLQGGVAIMIETEKALQSARALVFGADTDDVWLAQPLSFEEAVLTMNGGLDAIDDVTVPNLLAWDSIATADMQVAYDKGMDAGLMGKKSVGMAYQMGSIARRCMEKNACGLFVNQTRSKIGVMFGNPETTPGGSTHKFQASIRVRLSAPTKLKVGGATVGQTLRAKTTKNKLGMPDREAEIRLKYETGWDDAWSVINFAKKEKKLPPKAAVSAANVAIAKGRLGWAPLPEGVSAEPELKTAQKADPSVSDGDEMFELDEEDDD